MATPFESALLNLYLFDLPRTPRPYSRGAGKLLERRRKHTDPGVMADTSLQPTGRGPRLAAERQDQAAGCVRTKGEGISMKRRGLVVVALLSTGCGAANTTPTNTLTGLTAGRYQLSLIAPAGFQGCEPRWEQTFLSIRPVTVSLLRDGNGWTGRPESSFAGDVALRLRETPVNSRELAVSGTIQGVAVVARESGDSSGSVTLGVAFAAAAPVSGRVAAGARFAQGTIGGGAVFIDSQRAQMTCSSAEWRLSPLAF